MRVLLIEDDELIGDGIKTGLEKMGFTVDWFQDGDDGEEALLQAPYDAVVLDLGLPQKDGLEILESWRNAGKKEPVLILSARGDIDQRILGLNLGADDYLAKPFSMIEMAARVKAVLRRCHKDTSSVITVDKLKINEESRTISVNDIDVDLTYKEFELLLLLVKHEGRVYSREQLLDIVWGTDYDGESRTVDVHIRTLRQKLMSMDYIIKTVRGIGYKAEF